MTKKDFPEATTETAVEQRESSVKETPERARLARLDSVNAEIGLLRSRIPSSEDTATFEAKASDAFQSTIVGIQELVGTSVSEKTKDVIYANTVEASVKRSERQQERMRQLQKEKLHALLLTQDEEGLETGLQGKRVYAKKEFQDHEGSVILRGTSHAATLEKEYTVNGERLIQNLDTVYEELAAEKPSILMHEGKDIHDIFPGMSDEEIRNLDSASVISKSEQVYLPWKAFVSGIETKSWDLTMAEQFTMLLKSEDTSVHPKHTPEAIQAWLASAALGKIYEKKETVDGKDIVLDEEILEEILKYVVSKEEQESLKAIGVDCSAPAMLKALESFSGKMTKELFGRFNTTQDRGDDFSALRALIEPRKSSGEMGPTNWVLYDANHVRDVHAIDVLAEQKKKHQKIAMIAGASHVITWEPAAKELYNEQR